MSLFDDLEEKPKDKEDKNEDTIGKLCRNVSYEQLQEYLPDQEFAVFNSLTKFGGKTHARNISADTGIEVQTVRARLDGLMSKGVIEESGVEYWKPTNRHITVYKIKEKISLFEK